MTKTVVVVNPTAGRGRSARMWRELVLAEPRLADAHVVETSLPETASKELIQQLEAGCERVLVIGGDGSAHLVANRILELGMGGRIVLGLVPTGTGSDLARGLSLPRAPRAALRRVLAATPRRMDVLELTTDDGRRRFVLNVASAGISGLVDRALGHGLRRGSTAYLRGALRALRSYRPATCSVSVDGRPWYEGDLLILAVANGPCFGHGMRIAPDARLDDGRADVVAIRPVPRWQLPLRLPQLYSGTHLGSRYSRAVRARRVRVEPLGPVPPFDLDGEVFESAASDLVVIPGALRILA
jgi:diacylglycerol kinase (ATP)